MRMLASITQRRYKDHADVCTCGRAGMFSTSLCCGTYAIDTLADGRCAGKSKLNGSGRRFRPGDEMEEYLRAQEAGNATVLDKQL